MIKIEIVVTKYLRKFKCYRLKPYYKEFQVSFLWFFISISWK